MQIARETIARKVEESKYVGICKRFPLLRGGDTTRKVKSVQDNCNTDEEESAEATSKSIECRQNGQKDTVHLLDANGASRNCDITQINDKEKINDFHHLHFMVETPFMESVFGLIMNNESQS